MANEASEHDLRSFLDWVSDKGASSYLHVDKTISPRFETTAVVQGMARKLRSPVIRFDDVEGSSYPMVTNVCASIDRVAKSVGLTVDELNARFVAALDAPVAPVVVAADEAPVRAISESMPEFPLSRFPELVYTATQEQPYITSSIVVARDPDTGAHNLSFHRLMIDSDDVAAIYMTPGGHLDQIWKKNAEAGKPTPVAAAIGTHPLWCYASLVSGPLEHDDWGVAGAVLGAPIALTSGQVDPELLVPAQSEFVLEGLLDAVDSREEGPFGEFLGYVAEPGSRPVVRFTSMSSREAPIYQDIVAGQVEHLTMSSISLRARLERDYFVANPAVVNFWLPAPMTLFLAIDASVQTDFDADALMQDLLGESYLKQVYCFDADVDLRKLASVQSAIACFVQADRDVQVFEARNGNGVDPSEIDGKTAKVAVDARAKSKPVRSELPEDFAASFDLNDWIR
ncbi:MAG: UbiD family decarboxylase [Woeseiaceae bacterium]|nr:UbiD family decarboxylase [Woeseiaceae bacterium]